MSLSDMYSAGATGMPSLGTTNPSGTATTNFGTPGVGTNAQGTDLSQFMNYKPIDGLVPNLTWAQLTGANYNTVGNGATYDPNNFASGALGSANISGFGGVSRTNTGLGQIGGEGNSAGSMFGPTNYEYKQDVGDGTYNSFSMDPTTGGVMSKNNSYEPGNAIFDKILPGLIQAGVLGGAGAALAPVVAGAAGYGSGAAEGASTGLGASSGGTNVGFAGFGADGATGVAGATGSTAGGSAGSLSSLDPGSANYNPFNPQNWSASNASGVASDAAPIVGDSTGGGISVVGNAGTPAFVQGANAGLNGLSGGDLLSALGIGTAFAGAGGGITSGLGGTPSGDQSFDALTNGMSGNGSLDYSGLGQIGSAATPSLLQQITNALKGGSSAIKDATGLSPVQLGTSLYDAINRYQQNSANKNTLGQLSNIFGPNGANSDELRRQLERRDAAQGRQSQYGPREVELQSKLATLQAGVLNSANYTGLNQNSGQFNGVLNSLFANYGQNAAADKGAVSLSNITNLLDKYYGNGG